MIMYEQLDIKKLQIIVEAAQKPYISISEAACLYSLGMNTVTRLIKESGAERKIGKRVLVNVKVFNEYIETMYG